MSIESVKEYFRGLNMEERVLEFDVSSATVELAAKALDCEPQRIAKTMSFMLDEKCILVVTAGDARIDNGKYKRLFGRKARMVPAEKVEALTGHEVGGVCPFAVPDGTPVYLDVSLKRFETSLPRLRQRQQRNRVEPSGAGSILECRIVDRCLQTVVVARMREKGSV